MFAARLRISAVGLQRKQFLGKVERIEKVGGVMEKRAKSAGSGVLNPFVDWRYLNNESILYEMLLYLLIQMRNGMKTIEELK